MGSRLLIDMTEDARILYDQDGFMQRLLGDFKIKESGRQTGLASKRLALDFKTRHKRRRNYRFMTNLDLALSHRKKASIRLKVLYFLLDQGTYSNVTGEAQEAVELATKAMLRAKGIEPPSFMLWEHREKFNELSEDELKTLNLISKKLRKEREPSFYGDIDFIPTEEYTMDEAISAIEGTNNKFDGKAYQKFG